MTDGDEDSGCQRCGRCCTYPGNILQLAAPEEWEVIIDHLLATRGGVWRLRCRCSPRCNHSWEGEVRELEDLPVFLLEDIRPCPFLHRERDEGGRFTGHTSCEIYPVRPLVCRLYPMTQADADVYRCRAFSREASAKRAMPASVPSTAPSTLAARSRGEKSRSGTRT